MFLVCVFLLLLSLSGVVALPPPDLVSPRFTGGELFRSINDKHERNLYINNEYLNTTSAFFTQLINHSNPEGSTFYQRYWVDYSAWNGNDKAMLYIPGEGPGRSSPSGYPGIFGHKEKMILFTLENRYYGESMPSSLTDKEKLKNNLNVDIVLDDLRSFQIYIEEKLIGKKFRWLIVGGSYAGALSVWFKVKYPTAALAIWSSSGVVEPRLNFYAFDGHVKTEISPDCAESVRLVQSIFLEIWKNESSRINFLNRFNIPDYFEKEGISYMLADAVAGAVQYGKKWQMCNMIVPQNKTDPLGQFFEMIIYMYGKNFTSECLYSTKCLSNVSMSNQWVSTGYVWIYQTCSELAYFQVGYHDSLRLKDVSTDYFINQCRSIFGNSIFPDVYKFNNKWGGKKPNAGNVVALQGSDDPWIEVGVTKTLRSDYQSFIAECEGCGHCGDLAFPQSNDPETLILQRNQLTHYLNIWMSGESVFFILSINTNFSFINLINEEKLKKNIQTDLHDFFDHTSNIYSIIIDNDNHTLFITFSAYVNLLNKDKINSALINLQKSSSWLLNTNKVLKYYKNEVEIIINSFKKIDLPVDSKSKEIHTDFTRIFLETLNIFTLLSPFLLILAVWSSRKNIRK